MQPFCSTDYHSIGTSPTNSTALVAAQPPIVGSPNNTGYATSKSIVATGTAGAGAGSGDSIDALNSSYSTYNNWTNGYNNYQYGSCGPVAGQPQYPHAPPPPPPGGATMVLYPHVYSTVNQNQIHLHLHGTDKIEQYLSSTENGLTISSARGGIEIGIGTADNPNVIMDGSDDTEQHQQQQHHQQPNDMDDTNNRGDVVDQEGGDPASVWRPY